jgi:hypothetical protein
MSIFEQIFSQQFLIAFIIYAVLIAILFPLSARIHDRLENTILQWKWNHIAMPLFQAALLMIFILLTYPLIFGVEQAPSITSLLSQDDLRINYLVNLLFIISLIFPFIPVIGNLQELILPMQGIAASIESWCHGIQFLARLGCNILLYDNRCTNTLAGNIYCTPYWT